MPTILVLVGFHAGLFLSETLCCYTSMKRIALMLILIMPSFGWAENYLCIVEQSTGFKYMNGKWQSVTFNPVSKYLVSTEDLQVNPFGDEAPSYLNCEDTENDFICLKGWGRGVGAFEMSKPSLRFMATHAPRYYIFKLDNPNGTPWMEIGTCSKF